MKWMERRMKRTREQFVYGEATRKEEWRENNRGSQFLSLPVAAPSVAERARNLAPKFMQFMLAASLMEWYLQTRTNTSINYKTILPLGAVFLQRRFHALFPTLIHPLIPPPISPIYRATSLFLPSFYTSTTNFWSPAFPCNLENDRAEPRASQIFDTRRLGERKEKDAVFRTRPSGWRAAAVDGNGNRGTKRRWIQSWIGGAKGRRSEGGGARTGLEAGLVGD